MEFIIQKRGFTDLSGWDKEILLDSVYHDNYLMTPGFDNGHPLAMISETQPESLFELGPRFAFAVEYSLYSVKELTGLNLVEFGELPFYMAEFLMDRARRLKEKQMNSSGSSGSLMSQLQKEMDMLNAKGKKG